VMETVEKVLLASTPSSDEFIFLVGDEVKDFEYTVSPYNGVDNEGVAIAIADITKHKQVQRQLNQTLAEHKKLDEIKARFISVISHELRNPLNRVFVASQLLKNYANKWTEEQKNSQLNYILSAAKQTNQVLNDMLLVLKAECGKLKLQPGLLNLENFCRKLVEEMQVSINKGNRITFSCQGNPNVCLDEKLLRPILTNLLSNAVKYSPELSPVEFNLTCERDKAIFCIKDQGIGIPQSDQEQLFDSFQRASNVGNIEGTGIGLFIVKKCVDLQGGKIEIDSEVGRGTQITVSLPNLAIGEWESGRVGEWGNGNKKDIGQKKGVVHPDLV
jgi:signal transduction histidine kinase